MRPRSEIMRNMALELQGMNTMRPWPDALTEYLDNHFSELISGLRVRRARRSDPPTQDRSDPMPEYPAPSDQRRAGASDDRTVAVVIPIPDDPPWELFDAIPPEIPIIVSDDSDGQLAPPPRDNVYYFDYAAQRDYCGEHYAAMPHKSAASRNVGHYIAYKEGFDVIVALDYDCGTRPGWLEAHLEALDKVVEAPALAPVTPNGWVNSIDAPGVYARGYPYELRTPGPGRGRGDHRHRRGQDQHGDLGRHPRPERHRQAAGRRAGRPRAHAPR